MDRDILILGGGLAGLTPARQLARNGVASTLSEQGCELRRTITGNEHDEEGREVTEEELSQMALSQPDVPSRLS
jgi:2-polyprenyl-6-methoxyphenol hydroxylase-like FAD-dependent oxidoreductase